MPLKSFFLALRLLPTKTNNRQQQSTKQNTKKNTPKKTWFGRWAHFTGGKSVKSDKSKRSLPHTDFKQRPVPWSRRFMHSLECLFCTCGWVRRRCTVRRNQKLRECCTANVWNWHHLKAACNFSWSLKVVLVNVGIICSLYSLWLQGNSTS